MAKRRRVKPGSPRSTRPANEEKAEGTRVPATGRKETDHASEALSNTGTRLAPLSIAAGLFAGVIMYVTYYPSDSISVEQGDALWLTLLSLATATVCMGFGFRRHAWRKWSSTERVLTAAPWCLAAWIMFAAWGTSANGDLRMATNEGWLWVTAAALFTSSRILCQDLSVRRALTMLAIICAFALAVHGLHQYFVSLPTNRAAYENNPERILELAGVEAPAGSAERMVFENRLFDGGPTGTFALANSLAAALLVGVIAGVGLIRWRYRSLSPPQWFGVIALVLVCSGCLMAARSRSATLGMLIGISIVIVAASLRGRNKRGLYIGLSVAMLLGIAVVVFLATLGNREWFEQAPQSLAFRFQYWRSTWNLMLDHPWFGAGPGNFQSMYEQYREASAHEQIAEPHNLFVETLASGGFLGLGLLAALLVAGGIRLTAACDETATASAVAADDQTRWVWLGSGLSFAMVWLLGFAARQPPDLEASLWVVPFSVAIGCLLWRVVRSFTEQEIDHVWFVILIAIGIHLMAAGGWTVPGVAITFWLGGGLLTRIVAPPGETPEGSRTNGWTPHWIFLIAGITLMGLLYGMSIRPVEQKRRLMAVAINTPRPQQRREVLEQAVAADPWSPEAVLWLADWYRWALILQADTPSMHRQWGELLQVAKERAGDAPAVYRMIGGQQLHLYQRYGNPADLQAAAETFEKAVQWSPSDQWLMAQLSLIAEAQGRFSISNSLSLRAWELSESGGNIERSLTRQLVYPVKILGSSAENGPRLEAAADLLSARTFLPPR